MKEENISSESTSAASVRVRAISTFDLQLDHSHPEQQKQINQLREMVERLMLEVNDLRGLVEASPVRVRIIKTREASITEAKRMITEYMETNDVAYPDDIADELRLDLKLTVKAIDQLIKEGKIVETQNDNLL